MGTQWSCCRAGGQWLALLVVLFAANAKANTGYFTGSGHTITLSKSEQIQLVSEDVTIRPNCGWTPQMDSVDYCCQFTLKNLTTKPVKIQVGFPLNSQFVQEPKNLPSATALVLNYHFIARDEKTTYHTRFVANDSEKKFSRLFLWDMEFKPAETKVLFVTYQLGMSFGEVSTRNAQPDGDRLVPVMPGAVMPYHAKKWHAALEVSWVEHFSYVTETGKSWAGPIEHAVFRVQTEDLEKCLAKRDLMDQAPPQRPKDWAFGYSFPMKAGAIYEESLPKGWKRMKVSWRTEIAWYRDSESDGKVWEYRDYQSGEPLVFVYYVVAIPRAARDCDSWVRRVLGNDPNKADLSELREIVAAFYGIAPQSTSATRFAEQQVWYHPKNGLRESELKEEQQAVLRRLDAIAKGN
jgi:hypothetical protein